MNERTREGLAKALRVPVESVEQLERGQIDDLPPSAPAAWELVSDAARHVPADARIPGMATVPILGRSPAGSGGASVEPGYGHSRVLHLPEHIGRNPNVFAVEVIGTSMAPFLREGDWVVCNPSIRQSLAGAVYYVQGVGALDESSRIKRVYPVEGDAELLELRSNNTDYPSVRVGVHEARLALVVYVVRPAESLFEGQAGW